MIKLNIEIENEFKDWKINKKKIKDITKEIFNYLVSNPDISENFCLSGYEYNTVSFDILFCDGEKTHEINKQYRGKDYSADIITFAVFADSPKEERFMLDLEINLGEVIIALDKITQQAKEKGITRETELYFFISHGIMHLLGFDHQDEKDFEFVIQQQKSALKSIGIEYDKI